MKSMHSRCGRRSGRWGAEVARAAMWGRIAALALVIAAGGAGAASPAPPDPYSWCVAQSYLSREVDCRCYAAKMAAASAAEPGRAPEVHQQVAAAACPNEAGLREQETQKCLNSPALYLPRDRDVAPAAYCACWGREFARERVAFAPRVPLADSSSFWSAAAKARCDAAPHAAAPPPLGTDLSGSWQLAVLGYEVRVEMRPPQQLPTPAGDGSRTATYNGTGVRSGGKPLPGPVEVRAWTDASGQALDLREDGLHGMGCEGRKREAGAYEGLCFASTGSSYPFTWTRTSAGAVLAVPAAQAPAAEITGTSVVPTAAEREPTTDSARHALAAAKSMAGPAAVHARAGYFLRNRQDVDAARVLLAHLIDTYPGTTQAAWAGERLATLRADQARDAAQHQTCVGGPQGCAVHCQALMTQPSPDLIGRLNACYADCKQRCR